MTDVKGWTALHHAAARGRGKMARLLLLCGADPSLADKEGRTPRAVAEMASEEDGGFYSELDEEEHLAVIEEEDEEEMAERVERAEQDALATFRAAFEVSSASALSGVNLASAGHDLRPYALRHINQTASL